ncbi:MAG: NADH-quinone oxidoreductase subunit M [Pseudomonadota bacterium]|nr:NADH-quinone oxidoreductase subunit M [Pseudomonadota bacterium]
MDQIPLLTVIVVLPLAGALAVLAAKGPRGVQGAALGTTLAVFVLTLLPLWSFQPERAGFQLVERVPWIPSLGISYHLGLDGLSLFLLPLTGFLSVAAVLVSWRRVQEKIKAYYVSFLVLETGMLGVFVSLDAVLFYFFWEAMLIPMFFIIGIWGGANRRYAAFKFIIYTMAGSVFLLIGLLLMAFLHLRLGGVFTFDMVSWFGFHVPLQWQYGLFVLFFVAFAVKAPVFPFHTWLPDAHVEAPTAGSVILAGVLLKMGIYGILRFCLPLLPEATVFFTPVVMALGVIGIVYGALVAYAQDDLKKLVAYSSVSHMGLIVVGVMAGNLAGMKGGIIQMVNHGLSTGALFILVGAVYDRLQTREMGRLGGLAGRTPVLAAFFMIMTLSSLGLPGLNGFVGEFLLLLGAFRHSWWIGVPAAATLILGAVYMLWMMQRVFFATYRGGRLGAVADLSRRERLVMIPLTLLVFGIGLYPSFLTDRIDTVSRLLTAAPAARVMAPMTADHSLAYHPDRLEETNDGTDFSRR